MVGGQTMTTADGCGRRGMLRGSVFVYRRDGATSQWVPFGPPAPENKPVDFKCTHPPHNPASSLGGRSIWTWTKRASAVRSSVLPVAPRDLHQCRWHSLGECRGSVRVRARQRRMLDPRAAAHSAHGRLRVVERWGKRHRSGVPAPKSKFSHLGLARASSIRSIRSMPSPDTLNEQLRIGVNAPPE